LYEEYENRFLRSNAKSAIFTNVERHKGQISDLAAEGAELLCIIFKLHKSGASEIQ
jgi:hypothetical protein